MAEDGDGANQLVFLQHRNDDGGSGARKPGNRFFRVLGFDVRYSDDLLDLGQAALLNDDGVLDVKATAFYRPLHDTPSHQFYTHVASPEVIVDGVNQRLVMQVHGWFTDSERWPEDPKQAVRWAQEKAYEQYTQTAVSPDGLGFTTREVWQKRGKYASWRSVV
jgi:hypothetical protein